MYLEGRTLSQKPADIAGVVVDSKGREVSTFRTEHEGRGRFELTPVKGEQYTLRITEPSNVTKTVALPLVVNDGATVSSASDVVAAGQPVKLNVAWTGDRVVTVVLRQRDVELSRVTVDAGKQKGTTVALDAKDADGVLVATVEAKDGTPLAERLVFREPKARLSIALEPDRARYVPGAPVKLKLKTSVGGKPVSALVGLTVSDDSVQELIEKREQAPALPVMVLLEDDVRELADAHVYLDPKNPKAPRAVDLLLGTQGWRRFALMHVADFLQQSQDDARRALAFYDGSSLISEEDFAVPMDRLAAEGGAARGGLRMPPAAAMPKGAVPMAAPAPRPMARPAEAPKPAPAKDARLQNVAGGKADKQLAENKPMPGPMQPIVRAEAREKKEAWAGEVARRPVAFVTVHEYAHQVRPGRQPNDRLDFAETLYWAAAVKTDAKGEATVSFGTSDAVTSFRAAAGGYTTTGVLGSAEVKLDSVKPFYVEPKLPLEVTEGDVIRLPIAFVNGTKEPLSQVSMSMATKADLRFTAPQAFALKADERARKVVELTIGPKSHTTELTLNASAGGYQDVVTRPLAITPRGFPAQQSAGGLLEANGKATFSFTLPPDTVPGSVETSIQVYPSPSGNLSSALKSMVREPSGCFEQTSSTTYPMTMALTYFTTHTGADPAVVQDAQDKLDRGYKRLTGFECKQKGYEWFGEDPGHEALTAYGILQFTDMKKVRQVDAEMLARSKSWLLAQKDGKGGFERKRRALHTWIEDKDTSDAYITWALLEAGEKRLDGEVKHVLDAARASKNSYVVALGANVALLAGDKGAAKTLLGKLAEQQGADGFVKGGTQSIVGSTGQSLAIETTALATLAWLKAPGNYVMNVEKAMKGLAEASKDGSYGATQSTVLALRAVLAYDRARNAQRKPGAVQLLVDGRPFGKPVPYDGKTEGVLVLPDVSELLGNGAHTLELKQQGGGQLPWSIAVRSHRVKPESSPETKVALDVALPKAKVNEGDVVEVTARVTNRTDERLPTVVAIVGVPGGLEPRIDALKELVKAKTIDAYEVLGRDVVLYWRGMTPKQQVRVPVSLVAAVPGTYVGPASRAYLYYGNEHKVWVDGLKADVVAKN